MENINILQILAFSAAAYLLGHRAGKKVGFIQAVKSMPLTLLRVSNDIQLEEVTNEQNNTPT
jgi:hypothetical protein